MDYIIKNVNTHVEVYDRRGAFQFSADTEEEALRDLEDMTGFLWQTGLAG